MNSCSKGVSSVCEGKIYDLNSSEYATVFKEKTDFIDTQPELDFYPIYRKKYVGK